MKERPILFSTEMVQVILEGKKTQTRRVLKPQPGNISIFNERRWIESSINHVWADGHGYQRKCPYGQIGDGLWVRETWRAEELDPYGEDGIRYKADGAFVQIENSEDAAERWGDARYTKSGKKYPGWRLSIYMPRWASRITLEIVNVRVKRVQDITEKDAVAEGCVGAFLPADCEFLILWNSINAKRGYGWAKNPWVWAITFRRLKI